MNITSKSHLLNINSEPFMPKNFSSETIEIEGNLFLHKLEL